MLMPDESAKVSFLLNHVRMQVNTLCDPNPRLEALVVQIMGLLMGKKCYLFLELLFYSVFSLACAYTVAMVSASNAVRQPPNDPPPC